MVQLSIERAPVIDERPRNPRAFVYVGGAAGEPPPGSEKPDRRFLQAQFRFCLERIGFSEQESDAQQPRLSFGRLSEQSPRPSRTL